MIPRGVSLYVTCQHCGHDLKISWPVREQHAAAIEVNCECGALVQITYSFSVRAFDPWECPNCYTEIPVGRPHDFGTCSPALGALA